MTAPDTPNTFDQLASVKLIKDFYPIPRPLLVFWPALVIVTCALAIAFPDWLPVYPQHITVFTSVCKLVAFASSILMLTCMRSWFRVLPASEITALATVQIPEVAQQMLAATVFRRHGRIRCYDLIPVVFKTIKHRQGIKSCLQARKAKSDLQEKAGLENEQAKAASALLRRFGEA